jgi:hypothetical protein
MPRSMLAVAAVVVAALSGCGGESSEPEPVAPEEGAQAAVADFMLALATGDVPQACGLLTPIAQDERSGSRRART